MSTFVFLLYEVDNQYTEIKIVAWT